MTPVLVTIRSTAKDDENIPGTRELFIGCVRTMAVSQKKVGFSGIFGIKNTYLMISDHCFASVFHIETYEPHREKTGFLPRRKQRRRSASR